MDYEAITKIIKYTKVFNRKEERNDKKQYIYTFFKDKKFFLKHYVIKENKRVLKANFILTNENYKNIEVKIFQYLEGLQ